MTLLHILFHYGLSQDIEDTSLCSTVGPCWLSIVHILSSSFLPSLGLHCSARWTGATLCLWGTDFSFQGLLLWSSRRYRLSSWGTLDFITPGHVDSSCTRDQTRVVVGFLTTELWGKSHCVDSSVKDNKKPKKTSCQIHQPQSHSSLETTPLGWHTRLLSPPSRVRRSNSSFSQPVP